MTKMRSAVFVLLVIAALACDDGGSTNGTAGSGGMLAAGTGGIAAMAGTGGMAAGASGASGTTAGGGGMSGMAGGGGTGGMGENCVPSPNGPPQPSLTWIFDNVMPTCGGPLCHSSMAGGNLVFDTKDNTYAQLMMAGMGMNLGPSTSMTNCMDTGLMRVAPNNPDMSLLYAKLRTDMDPPCGNRMPPGGGLCANTIEAIRMWIASGAPNN